MKKVVFTAMATIFLCTYSCSVDDSFNLVAIAHEDLCNDGNPRIVGEGPVITRTLSLGEFHSLTNLQGIDISISQSYTQQVTATGPANIINRIRSAVAAGEWTVVLEEGCYANLGLSLEIGLPRIRKITSRASGSIELYGFKGLDSLEIISMGSGPISAIPAFSTLQHLKVDNRGSGHLNLYPLEAVSCSVLSAGSGHTMVTVQDSLTATLRGSGDIRYKGSPVISEVRTGSGVLVNDN